MKGQLGGLVYILSFMAIFILVYLISQNIFQEQFKVGKYLLEDYINYQRFLYFVYVYTPFVIREYIYSLFGNYLEYGKIPYLLFHYYPLSYIERLLSRKEVKIYGGFYINCRDEKEITEFYNNSIYLCKPLIPVLTYKRFVTRGLFRKLEEDLRILLRDYLESIIEKMGYDFIVIKDSNVYMEDANTEVSFYYSFSKNKLKRTLFIKLNYSLLPYFLDYSWHFAKDLEELNFYQKYKIKNIKDFINLLKETGNKCDASGVVEYNKSFWFSYKKPFIYANIVPRKHYLNFVINCTLFGGDCLNGQCLIPMNERGDYKFDECFNESYGTINIDNPNDFTEKIYTYNFTFFENSKIGGCLPDNLTLDEYKSFFNETDNLKFLSKIDYYLPNKIIDILKDRLGVLKYNYYLVCRENLKYKTKGCIVGYINKASKVYETKDGCKAAMSIMKHSKDYGFFIKDVEGCFSVWECLKWDETCVNKKGYISECCLKSDYDYYFKYKQRAKYIYDIGEYEIKILTPFKVTIKCSEYNEGLDICEKFSISVQMNE